MAQQQQQQQQEQGGLGFGVGAIPALLGPQESATAEQKTWAWYLCQPSLDNTDDDEDNEQQPFVTAMYPQMGIMGEEGQFDDDLHPASIRCADRVAVECRGRAAPPPAAREWVRKTQLARYHAMILRRKFVGRLVQTYERIFDVALEAGADSLALPGISTGACPDNP